MVMPRGMNPYWRVGAYGGHQNLTDNGSIGKEMDSERKCEIKLISGYYLHINFRQTTIDYCNLAIGFLFLPGATSMVPTSSSLEVLSRTLVDSFLFLPGKT